MVAALAVVVTGCTSGRHGTLPPSVGSSTTSIPAPTVSSSTTSAVPPLTLKTGLHVAVADDIGVTVLDLDTSTTRSIPIEGGAEPLFADGTHLIVQSRATGTDQNSPVLSVSTSSVDAPPVLIGRAYHAFPSATNGRIWLVNATSLSGDALYVEGTVQERDLAGHPTSPAYPLQRGRAPITDTGHGLVTQQQNAGDSPERLDLWRPQSARFVRNFTLNGEYVAGQGTTVIWDWCGQCTVFHVVNAATGADRAVRLRRSVNAPQAVFDPKHQRVALATLDAPVAVVDLKTGGVSNGPGEHPAYPVFSADGSWLFYVEGSDKVVAWHVGDANPETLPVKGSYSGIVVW
jgi:hypothetical protein